MKFAELFATALNRRLTGSEWIAVAVNDTYVEVVNETGAERIVYRHYEILRSQTVVMVWSPNGEHCFGAVHSDSKDVTELAEQVTLPN
jgi:helix-turn-helix protein